MERADQDLLEGFFNKPGFSPESSIPVFEPNPNNFNLFINSVSLTLSLICPKTSLQEYFNASRGVIQPCLSRHLILIVSPLESFRS